MTKTTIITWYHKHNFSYFQGQTGPCVYGAGYIYVFSILYYLTDKGKNIFVKSILFDSHLESSNHLLHSVSHRDIHCDEDLSAGYLKREKR